MSLTSKLFQGGAHAELYAKFRPVVPNSVVTTILDYCKKSKCEMKTALDIGCGSGQSTIALSKHFSSVIGADISETQIAQAPKNISGVSFHVSPAEDLSYVPSGSVDLITVAQALHWMDLDLFYPEVERVLKTRGVLAVYGYAIPQLDIPAASQLISEMWLQTMDGFKDKKLELLDNHYRDIPSPPFGTFQRDDSLVMSKEMCLTDLIGYFSSWSPYRTLLKEKPDSQVLEILYKRLLEVYSASPSAPPSSASEPQVKASWQLFILLSSKQSQ